MTSQLSESLSERQEGKKEGLRHSLAAVETLGSSSQILSMGEMGKEHTPKGPANVPAEATRARQAFF